MGIYQTSYTEEKMGLEIIRFILDDCADLLTIVDHIAEGRKECHARSEFVTKKYAQIAKLETQNHLMLNPLL